MSMRYFDPFVVPFTVGMVVLFVVIIYKYVSWFRTLTAQKRMKFWRGTFSLKFFTATKETVEEVLLHRSIFKVNPVLWYMHFSLAFGWFLLIVVGKLETSAYLKDVINLPHTHVFFRYFFPEEPFRFHRGFNYAFLMDAILLFVLSGVLLAWIKRMRSKFMGMKKTTKHTLGDKLALSSLWFVFPLRLLAEGATCGLHYSGDFLTGAVGGWMMNLFGENALRIMELPLWWGYSLALGVFFLAMPFSRYMHIFTEVPHIFLKTFGIRPKEDKPCESDNFQIHACSRCGICIDPCQLQSSAGINDVQSVYFLRDRRYGHLTPAIADNCLMCGRCEVKCPVHINLNTLRQNSRTTFTEPVTEGRYDYAKGTNLSEGKGKTGYFAGCMTLLSAPIITSMEKIFNASGDEVWWADRNGGICCGRPLKLSGEVDAARRLMEHNKELFVKEGITTLVTSCPICLKVFREDYALEGIEVIHHSQYILRLLNDGKIKPGHADDLLTYHDPCELGRGLGIYEEPRQVISAVASLKEPKQTGRNAMCCGGSVANLSLSAKDEDKIAVDVMGQFSDTGASVLVTACPQCKSSLKRNAGNLTVKDLCEIIAEKL